MEMELDNTPSAKPMYTIETAARNRAVNMSNTSASRRWLEDFLAVW